MNVDGRSRFAIEETACVKPQIVDYARSGELSIAYQVLGDGPIDLVFVPLHISTIFSRPYEPFATFYERLASLQLTQHLLGRRADALLLFDEAEDLLEQPGGSLLGLWSRQRNGSKVHANRLIEHNPVPVLCILYPCDRMYAFISSNSITTAGLFAFITSSLSFAPLISMF